jgi:hypothetical protein
MEPVKITVQNLSTVLTDDQASEIVTALNTQVVNDYGNSCWVTQGLSAPATVEFIAKGQPLPPDTWHVELLDTSDQQGALGYHEDQAFDHNVLGKPLMPCKASNHSSRGLRADAPEVPLAKVFVKTALEDHAEPGEVLSHECLECLVDPQVVKAVRTVINPAKTQKVIVEVGDPVQQCGYMIGNVTVADFALPAWFGYLQTRNPTQMSWRASVTEAFELAPGGYISVCPEGTEEWQQVFGGAA